MKITIIGGGSTYNPPFVHALLERRDSLPIKEIAFMDTDPQRQEIVVNFIKRHLRNKGMLKDVKIWATTNLTDAVADADFVIVTIRPGGNRLRALGERIALKYGMIGDETVGFEGFAFALRTIPALIKIAKEVERNAPNAWIINVTNPVTVATEAMVRYSNVKIIGVGSIKNIHRYYVARWLKVDDPEKIRMIYVGHKHFGWYLKIWVGDKEVPIDEMVDKYSKWVASLSEYDRIDPEFIRDWRWPIPDIPLFFKYYYMTDYAVDFWKKRGKTRGEEVVELQKELLEWFKKANTIDDIPDYLFRRGSTELERGEAAKRRGYGAYMPQLIEILDAIINDRNRLICEMIPQSGAVDGFDEKAVLRIPFILNKRGYWPIRIGKLPPEIDGILHLLKAHDYLTIKAAVTGSCELAIKALLSHPLVMNYHRAKKAFMELLTNVGREYYPQFMHCLEKWKEPSL